MLVMSVASCLDVREALVDTAKISFKSLTSSLSSKVPLEIIRALGKREMLMEQEDKALIRGAAYAILVATATFASFQVFLTLSMTIPVPADVVGLSVLRCHVPLAS